MKTVYPNFLERTMQVSKKALRNNILFFVLIALIYTGGAVGGYVFGYLQAAEPHSITIGSLLFSLALGIFGAIATAAGFVQSFILPKKM